MVPIISCHLIKHRHLLLLPVPDLILSNFPRKQNITQNAKKSRKRRRRRKTENNDGSGRKIWVGSDSNALQIGSPPSPPPPPSLPLRSNLDPFLNFSIFPFPHFFFRFFFPSFFSFPQNAFTISTIPQLPWRDPYPGPSKSDPPLRFQVLATCLQGFPPRRSNLS